MGLFSGLSDKINHVFSKIAHKGCLTELEIKQVMREIRIALLEADVNYTVVKQFIASVSEKALREEILKSLTPDQQVIKIVNEELVSLMGGANAKLEVSPKPPSVVLMCGLQGAGKTTMCGKLAAMLKKQGKKPLLVACDIYRPAAIKQLQIVGEKVGVEVFEKGTQAPDKTSTQAVAYAKSRMYDTVIIDTAGRLHINEELMLELKKIKKAVEPIEILLNVDAMTGQDAVTVAETFNAQLDVTGVILTKLDGDTRGGAALSIKAITGKPIKFCGIGEKMTDLEPFYPDRMASRILGMGDVLTLIEKAQANLTEDDMRAMGKKLKDASFTLDDFLKQYEQLGQMGSIQDILGMLPGANKLKIKEGDLDESQIAKQKAIIQSMTKQERNHPEVIKASRRKRIADGSGTTIQDVNALLNKFEQSKQLMKKMGGNGKRGMRLPF